MPAKKIDHSGKKFGRLTLLKRENDKITSNGYYIPHYLCKCECGNEKIINITSLLNGRIKSCGCLKKEKAMTHGLSQHPLGKSYYSMLRRCSEKCEKKQHYFDRDINVCLEWKNDIKSFFNWAIKNGWKKGLELDRIDNNKGYSPENCRWITHKENTRNTRKTLFLEFNGKKASLAEWAELKGLSRICLWFRLYKLNWSIKDALTIPVGGRI